MTGRQSTRKVYIGAMKGGGGRTLAATSGTKVRFPAWNLIWSLLKSPARKAPVPLIFLIKCFTHI